MTKRIRHYLKPNKHSEIPSNVIWTDTETKPHIDQKGVTRHRLWFGWACYQRSRAQLDWCAPVWRRYTRAREFWEWVSSLARPRTVLYIFCHNTNFDLPVLRTFKLPMQMGWVLTRAVIDGPPTIITMRKGSATIKLLDTLNFWRVSLKELGKAIGVAKLPMPSSYSDPEMWDQYARQDVEVIRRALLEWWGYLADQDMGGFAPTLAGQAMRTWRHRYMRHRVLIDDNELALRLSRAAYLGGRNECFRHGRIEGPIYYLDINSMYPSVMRGNPYPVELFGVDRRNPERTWDKFSPTHAAVGRVKLSCQERLYPLVLNGRLCFPVGEFWATLAGPELRYAVTHGHVTSWESVAVYHQAEIFTEFIDELYKLRLRYKAEGNEVYAYFIKILMNSLYGKFGQRGMVWEESGRTEDEGSKSWVEYDVITRRIKRCRQLAGLIQTKSEEGEARESFPAIAAYVTSYARMALYRLMQRVGMENTLYCDTDGVFVTQEGYERVRAELSPVNLGAAKLEHTAPYVVIRGLKDYNLGGKVKVKGVKANAHWLTDSEVLQEQWSGLTGQLGRGDLNNATTRTLHKKLSRQYTKGVFLPDGRVAPIELAE